MSELTDAEIRLFKGVGQGWLIPLVQAGQIFAPNAYDMAAMEVFINDNQGPWVEALRRAVARMKNGGYRGNPEFDKMISPFKCEKCDGPGPCLWGEAGMGRGRYLCVKCHPNPDDVFFALNLPENGGNCG